jgi:hypothetical protein
MPLAPAVGPEADHAAGPRPGRAATGWRALLEARPVPLPVVAAVLAVLTLPLVVAAVALRRPTWFPVLDLAMTELRVRDVGGPDTPLIGLPGRIGTLERQGSHPGPISFYLLVPAYRLLGSSAWALQVSAMVLNVAAMGTALAVARLRGGLRMVLGVATVLAVLGTAYGFSVLTEPWNPYMPLLWWVAFLLAAWSVALGDWRLLPVAVGAASFCAQTHLPYLGLAGGVGAVAVAIGAATLRTPEARRAVVRPVLVAVAVVGVLWAPVLVDQVARDPGNLTLLREHMFDPPEEPVGFRTGLRVMLVHLDLSQLLGATDGGSGSLVDTSYDPYGSVVPGIALLAVWGAAVAVAWRLRIRGPLTLHALVATGLALGVYSTGRVFGKLWYYLTLWAWGLAVLAAGAVLWTLLAAVERRLDQDRRERSLVVTSGALAGAVVVLSVALAWQAPGTEPPAPLLSRGLGLVIDPTEAALREGVGASDGPDGRYVVTWTDALHIGSQGYGLVSELERRGLDAGGMPWAAVPITSHRVVEPEDATAMVHLATGSFIERWRDREGVVEVAHVDPRTPDEQAEFARLRDQVLADLAAAGLDDLVPVVDGNLFGASLDPRLDDETHQRMGRMLDLGIPISVFVAPPGTSTL